MGAWGMGVVVVAVEVEEVGGVCSVLATKQWNNNWADKWEILRFQRFKQRGGEARGPTILLFECPPENYVQSQDVPAVRRHSDVAFKRVLVGSQNVVHSVETHSFVQSGRDTNGHCCGRPREFNHGTIQ